MENHPYPVPPVSTLRRERKRRAMRGCRNLVLAVLMFACLGALLIALAPILLLDARVNVLVLGLDRRPGEGDAVRADTVMVLSANAARPDLGLLSIPRDLYLSIPGQGENRINTAHFFGELEQAGGGPARTAATIEQNFGVPVDGWVRVDFAGFVAVVDALGGIEIDVPRPIFDDAYPTEDYGTMTVNIPAGVQVMDGERALQYARSRHGSSDLKRAERQQMVVQAMVRKLLQPATWVRLPALLNAFTSAVEIDLSWLQMARVAVAVVRVGPEKMERLVLDENLVEPYTTPAGASVLLPRWEQIRPLLGRVFPGQ